MVTYSEAVMSTLGHNIRELRQAKGWTQQNLADEVGVSRVTIARIEIGMSMPDFAAACNLADALGVTTDDLRQPRKIPAAVG